MAVIWREWWRVSVISLCHHCIMTTTRPLLLSLCRWLTYFTNWSFMRFFISCFLGSIATGIEISRSKKIHNSNHGKDVEMSDPAPAAALHEKPSIWSWLETVWYHIYVTVICSSIYYAGSSNWVYASLGFEKVLSPAYYLALLVLLTLAFGISYGIAVARENIYSLKSKPAVVATPA